MFLAVELSKGRPDVNVATLGSAGWVPDGVHVVGYLPREVLSTALAASMRDSPALG
jgi:hypothetical protein